MVSPFDPTRGGSIFAIRYLIYFLSKGVSSKTRRTGARTPTTSNAQIQSPVIHGVLHLEKGCSLWEEELYHLWQNL